MSTNSEVGLNKENLLLQRSLVVVKLLGFEMERVFRISNKNLDLSRRVKNLLLNLASIEGLNNHRSYDLGLFEFVDKEL